jgi:DNA-binding NarL/FixJ family response regulator
VTDLTTRENAILQLVAQGLRSRDIAGQLSITHSTVKNHLSNIYRKLGIGSRTQLVLYAMRHGLIESEATA